MPTIYVRLLNTPGIRDKLSSLRYYFVSSSAMPAELVHEWKSLTGLDIHEAYGMTETATLVTYNHYFRHVIGSVGAPVEHRGGPVRDQKGNPLPQGSEGEICMRGPNICERIPQQPGRNEDVFWEGGWLRSGDVGVFNEEGYLFVVDRLKDMVITGGENVYPREVKGFLYTWPNVEECAVIGLPDPEYGERVTACIVLKEKDKELDPKEPEGFSEESARLLQGTQGISCGSRASQVGCGQNTQEGIANEGPENGRRKTINPLNRRGSNELR